MLRRPAPLLIRKFANLIKIRKQFSSVFPLFKVSFVIVNLSECYSHHASFHLSCTMGISLHLSDFLLSLSCIITIVFGLTCKFSPDRTLFYTIATWGLVKHSRQTVNFQHPSFVVFCVHNYLYSMPCL